MCMRQVIYQSQNKVYKMNRYSVIFIKTVVTDKYSAMFAIININICPASLVLHAFVITFDVSNAKSSLLR